MRVTARTYYQDYAKSVGNLHGKLNESMEQVSTGTVKYKAAAADENPIAYYAGKRMDTSTWMPSQRKVQSDDVKSFVPQQGRKGALRPRRYACR